MDTITVKNQIKTRFVAHRGLSGIERENTLPAFVAAGNRSYFGIECDVHVTKDGKYIVFHDDETGRVCDRNIPIEASTAEELRALRVKDSQSEDFTDSLKLPYLAEYLAACARYDKTAVIELKNPMASEDIENIIDICSHIYHLNKIIFISFCFENLVFVRQKQSGQAVEFLCDRCDDQLVEKLKKHNFDIDILYTALTEELVGKLHSAGIVINCWTCDDPTAAARLSAWGVDYITSNILE